MATTIMVDDITAELLRGMKKETDAQSISEVVAKLARKDQKIPQSMCGIFEDAPIPPMTQEDEDEMFHEL